MSRNALEPPTSAAEGPTAVVAPAGGGLATRRCGRCLEQFPEEPDVVPGVIPELWMCPACRRKLFGKLTRAGASVSPPVDHLQP